jgi:MFS family permease
MIADAGGDRERGKLITWMNSTQRFGMLVAPAIGGLVASYDLRLPFILHGLLVLLTLIPGLLLTKETAPPESLNRKSGDGDWSFIFAELRRPQMLYFLAAQVFANLTRGNIQLILNFYMAYEYGRGPESLGLIASVNSLLNIPIGLVTGTVMDRYGRKKTVVPGFLGLFGSAFFLAWTAYEHSPFSVFLLGYYLLNVSQGITAGNMQVLGSDLAPARARGRFIGLWRFMAELGNASSPTLFSALAVVGYVASFSFIGGCALMVALIIGVKVRETVGARRIPVEPPARPDAAESDDGPNKPEAIATRT